MKKVEYVYQLSLRRANNKTKRFEIETDTIISKRKFEQKDIDTMGETFKCDVIVMYIGVLTPTSKENVLETKYHSKEVIEKYLEKWSKETDGRKISKTTEKSS